MRALVCSRLDGPDGLAIGELPVPEVDPNSVRVAVRAAGANFPDVLMTRGLYQDQPEPPFAPGMELAGEIVEIGSGVTTFEVGSRVYGYVRHGAFAAEAVVPSDRLFPMPDDMDYDSAAVFPIAYGTGYHALVDRAQLAPTDTLLVLGAAGGVGTAAIQIGKAVGATVIAAVSSPVKAEAAGAAGADKTIRYDERPLREALREVAPDGIDVVYDPVGGDATEAAFRSLAWKGRHLVVGFAAGAIPELAANLPLLKGASLVGVFWGRFTDVEPAANWTNFATLTEWWQKGLLAPVISERFSLDRSVEAIERLASRAAIGKMVVNP